jgi:3,5-epimerase/4-reductase
VIIGTELSRHTGIYTSTYNKSRDTLTSRPFTEEDTPNFGGSFYSFTKSRVEDLLRHYENVLVLRVRMPVSDVLHGRSFVTKIKGYKNVVNIPNSHSILHDLLPVAVALAENGETGVVNFTNPGAISHNEVLSLYKEIIDPAFTWQNFTLEEQSKVVKADRSNCELDASKLLRLVERYREKGYEIDVPEIHEAYRNCFERMKAGMQQKPAA